MGIRTAVVVVACCAAGPALPCSPSLPATVSNFVLRSGDEPREVPTNVALAVFPADMGPWSAIVRKDDGVDVGEVFPFEGVAGVDGFLDLEPDTAYVVDLPPTVGSPTTLHLITTGGPDDEAPAAPDVDVDREDTGPSPGFSFGECGSAFGPAGHWGGTSNNLDVIGVEAGENAVMGYHVVATDQGDTVRRDAFIFNESLETSFFEFDGGVWSVAVSAIDIAGNEGDATDVDVDFGGCGGCASSSTASTTLGLIALAGIRRRRVR